MVRKEWTTPQKSRIISEVQAKVEFGKSVRGLWKEKKENGDLEKGEWPARSTYKLWMNEVDKHGIDKASRRKRKQSLITAGRERVLLLLQKNNRARVMCLTRLLLSTRGPRLYRR